MLRVCISFLLVSSAYALVPDAYDQRTHKDWSIRISLQIYLVTFKIPKTAKNLTETSKWSQKLRKKNCPNSTKILLKIRLSIRVRTFAPLNEPVDIFQIFLYFIPKVPPPPLKGQ
jgi:hypothetical protein